MKNPVLSLIAILAMNAAIAQSKKPAQYFDNPIVLDSGSTILIPTRYNSDWWTDNKIIIWGDNYANLFFYNFKTDTYKRLFEKDTYIVAFSMNDSKHRNEEKVNTSKWLFIRVRNVDHDRNGKINSSDPAILYVCDLKGENLKALTTENENVMDVTIFEKQNMALLKIQRDADADFHFENEDKDYYYVKVDLNTLSMGNKIELK
jgi:hypothetical protein